MIFGRGLFARSRFADLDDETIIPEFSQWVIQCPVSSVWGEQDIGSAAWAAKDKIESDWDNQDVSIIPVRGC